MLIGAVILKLESNFGRHIQKQCMLGLECRHWSAKVWSWELLKMNCITSVYA